MSAGFVCRVYWTLLCFFLTQSCAETLDILIQTKLRTTKNTSKESLYSNVNNITLFFQKIHKRRLMKLEGLDRDC